MINSNYGESATISHEPEVGDIYYDAKRDIKLLMTDIKLDWYYWCCGIYEDGRVFDYIKPQDFAEFIYLGKAKNPITSIFEVE